MKLFHFALPLLAATCLSGCHQDEYEYHDVTRHPDR